MSTKINKCPACGQFLETPGEFAAHVCPTDDSQGAQALAKIQSSKARQERASLRPTPDNLLRDVAQATRELHDAWDGEVDVIVALAAKGSMNVAWCTNISDPERTRAVLKLLWRKTTEVSPMKTGD